MDIDSFFTRYKDSDLKILFGGFRTYFKPEDVLDLVLKSKKCNNLLMFWIKNFYRTDFYKNMVTTSRLLSFLDKSGSRTLKLKLLVLNKTNNINGVNVIKGNDIQTIWDLNAKKVAEQLFLNCHAILSKITANEFVTKFMKKAVPESYINLTTYTNLFNRVTNIVSQDILKSPSPKSRTKLLRKILGVCNHLYKLKSYHMLAAVVVATSQVSIARLEEVSRLEQIFNKFEDVISPIRNYKNYHQEVNELDGYYQPYLAPHLKDMTFLFEGGGTNNSIIDIFAKTVFHFRENTCPKLDSMDRLESFDKILHFTPIVSDDDLYELSIKIKPLKNTVIAAPSSEIISRTESLDTISYQDDDSVGLVQLMTTHIDNWTNPNILSWLFKKGVHEDVLTVFRKNSFCGKDLLAFTANYRNYGLKLGYTKPLVKDINLLLDYFKDVYHKIENTHLLDGFSDLPENWDQYSVAKWLTILGFDDHSSVFESNIVDGKILPYLEEKDLKRLGLIKLGPRKILKMRIIELIKLQKVLQQNKSIFI